MLPLPVNGGWSPWSNSGSCSEVCGTGTQYKKRTCDHPEPTHGGDYCEGKASDSVPCNTHPCPGIIWYYIFRSYFYCSAAPVFVSLTHFYDDFI